MTKVSACTHIQGVWALKNEKGEDTYVVFSPFLYRNDGYRNKSGINLRLRRSSISKGLNDISFWKSSLHHITTHKTRTLPDHLLFLLA